MAEAMLAAPATPIVTRDPRFLAGRKLVERGLADEAVDVYATLLEDCYLCYFSQRQALLAQPLEIAFFQNITVLSVYLLFSPFWAELPTSGHFPMLGAAAAIGITSMMLLSWAYARAEARVLPYTTEPQQHVT